MAPIFTNLSSTLTLFLSILYVQGQHLNDYEAYCVCDLPPQSS